MYFLNPNTNNTHYQSISNDYILRIINFRIPSTFSLEIAEYFPLFQFVKRSGVDLPAALVLKRILQQCMLVLTIPFIRTPSNQHPCACRRAELIAFRFIKAQRTRQTARASNNIKQTKLVKVSLRI